MVTVDLKEETWRRLQSRKDPGDSFDDVVGELLEKTGQNHDEAKA